MEPDMAVEMTHKLNDSGAQIKVLHADNDSTTTSRLKVHFEDLEKKDDQNHVKKGFSKKLYELSKKYKELKHPDVIPYLVRCFMYAIKENEGSTDDLRKGLNRLVLMFQRFTLYAQILNGVPTKMTLYKSLPGGKCLSNDALTSELRELVQQYNRRAESLQNMGSTQANENFNQIVGSKCPKASSTDYILKEKIADENGRYLILTVEIDNTDFVFVNYYAPTKNFENDQIEYIEKLKILLNEKLEQNLVLGGDFNTILNPSLDKMGGSKYNTPVKYTSKLEDFIEEFDLCDIWRTKNVDSRLYTWRQRTPLIQCRLDFWLISNFLSSSVTKTSIVPSIKSDHSLIKLTLSGENFSERGPGFWKFNSGLLTDKDYVDIVKNTLSECDDKYQNLENKNLKWDTIKSEIRGATVKYSKYKNMKLRERESSLKKRQDEIQKNLSRTYLDKDINTLLIELDIVKEDLEQIVNNQTRGAIIRSHAEHCEGNERNSKYFLSLEKLHKVDNGCLVKGKCHRSQRKNESPHDIEKDSFLTPNKYKFNFTEGAGKDLDRRQKEDLVFSDKTAKLKQLYTAGGTSSVKQKIFMEKNTNLEHQKCIEALKTQLKNQQIIESERDQFKQELENLRRCVYKRTDLKDQVIEKDKTVKMVQDLYYLRSTEFTDEIQSLKMKKQTLEKEKADLCSKVNFQADSISQLTFQLQDLNHELHLVSCQTNSDPIITDTITTEEAADSDSAKSEDGLDWEERHM
ncbi:unnamed protein product [Mytilus edulis]|uniref:Mutator-like transposase domain-containing protein n=1 Tax=Mytilus edulis TaxID=6550 RepID=A0A8S3UC03_MYTED|nr:unnamed protein product [Mytilus edulis]